jgi:S1-C subfamily serine protease
VAVVDEVGAAVVKIEVTRTSSQSSESPYQPFGDRSPSERQERGTGSGFIFRADGYILTNAHVVGDAKKVKVKLRDGRWFEGTVVGADPVTDVAVVKIEEKNLPTVQLGNSDQLQTGEWAIAIGSPLGLDNTVTTGIISATGRSAAQIGVSDYRVQFLQTDAAINPGNSGGPLLNAQGKAIGMNTAIIQNAQGLGFAIPINRVQQIAGQLMDKGTVEHPFLGIEMVALTPEIQEELNSRYPDLTLDEAEGILIVGVVADSPAEKAGLRSGDVIQKIGDRTVTTAEQVQEVVSANSVGSKLKLELKRDGQTRTIEVEIGVLNTSVRSR